MSWQDDLRQLDSALAAGRISADDYRRERDRLLAEATGGGDSSRPPTPPQPMPAQQPPAQEQPQPQGPPSDPFPAPFKWSVTPPESTQVVDPNAPRQGGDSDRTQIVQSVGRTEQPPERTQVVPTPSEQTQAIRPVESPFGQPPPPWQQQQRQPPPNMQGGQQSPWVNEDQPLGWPGFHAQGPEVFDSEPKSGRGKLFGIIGAVLVVLLIAGGILWLTVFNKKTDNNAGPTTNPPPPSASSTKKGPDSYGTLIVADGTSAGLKTYTAEQLATAKPLPTPDLVLLKQAGVSEARSVISVDKTTTVSLWAFVGQDPAALLQSMLDDQTRFGFAEVPDLAQNSVKVYSSKQDNKQDNKDTTIFAFRAHYVSGNEVIRVEAFDVDESLARQRFQTALTAQIKHDPPR